MERVFCAVCHEETGRNSSCESCEEDPKLREQWWLEEMLGHGPCHARRQFRPGDRQVVKAFLDKRQSESPSLPAEVLALGLFGFARAGKWDEVSDGLEGLQKYTAHRPTGLPSGADVSLQKIRTEARFRRQADIVEKIEEIRARTETAGQGTGICDELPKTDQ